MISTSEGGGGSWKSGHSKGGSMNFIYYKSVPNADKGEGGQKIPKFCGCLLWIIPYFTHSAMIVPASVINRLWVGQLVDPFLHEPATGKDLRALPQFDRHHFFLGMQNT